MEKVMIIIYTCASTKAVYLDIVPDNPSASLVRSLQRFKSRRGIPRLIITDNAKCFKGSSFKKYIQNEGIYWEFILERSPWWGGFWERLVQSVKRPLRKILKKSNITYEELLTITTEIEGVINSRPLCYLNSDDLSEIVTPSHLLYGRRILSKSSDRSNSSNIQEETVQSISKRLKHLKRLIDNFKTRWSREYLLELREYQKLNNKKPANELAVGDVVLIFEDKQPRSKWKMGIVHELIKSKDNLIRGCKLKVIRRDNGTIMFINRPINQLVYFEVSQTSDTEHVEDKNIVDVNIDQSSKTENKSTRPRRVAAQTGQTIRKILMQR